MIEKEKAKLEKKQTLLTTYINKLYPDLQKTPVSTSMIGIIKSVKPYCQPNPLQLLGVDLIETEENFAIIRGSSTKRDQLYTPVGYWDVARVFKTATDQQIGDDARGIAHQVVEHMQQGPHDLDVLYILKDQVDSTLVEQRIITELNQQGFTVQDDGSFNNNQGFSVKINKFCVECKSGNNTVFCVNYYQDGRFLMRLDIGQLPNANQLADDGRYSIFAPAMDIVTASNVGEINGQLIVETPIFPPEVFTKQEAAMCSRIPNGYEDYYANYLMGFLSSISNSVLWSSTKVDEPYSFLQLMINTNASAAYVYHYLEQQSGLLNPDEIQKLTKREVDIVSRFFLIFTYDLPLALELFYFSYLGNATVFGDILHDKTCDATSGQYLHRKFKAVRAKVAKLIDPGFSFDPKPKKAMKQLPELSRKYKEKLIQATSIEETGLFIFLQAMKECGVIDSSTPLSLSTLVDGFSPLQMANLLQARLA